MMKKLTLVIVGLVLTIGAVAAQQPRATPSAPAEKPADKTAAVLAALKGNGPAVADPTPTDPPSTLDAVLDRYTRMAAAGQQTPASVTPAARPPRPATPTSASAPAVSMLITPSTPVAGDSLDAIRADLRALLGRLDALAYPDGGGQ